MALAREIMMLWRVNGAGNPECGWTAPGGAGQRRGWSALPLTAMRDYADNADLIGMAAGSADTGVEGCFLVSPLCPGILGRRT
jgi:hypothetical protein